ncbi:peroxidase family protein [Fuscovulum ytuae]|uniref:Peroxidase family protein n=1 Tax=Fuscovulum ytuae TaxID=3042299 RepID=A0ABY8Q6G2_9RHOB|nr:peroxidase family protein [Fuscovulum sp. YMD61]WGV15870.1 peroxidase family protein [Fuscovulum sp. YMD61]
MVTLNLNDLAHILEQIKIAEAHSAAIAGGADARASLEALITNPLIPTGLRTVSGVLNNYTVGYTGNGAADELMQRLLTPEFNVAEMSPERTMTVADPNNPGQMMTITIPSVQTSYAQTSGSVYDSQPRTISNLIADQTLGNIAAISAALQIVGITGVDNLNISKQIHAAYEAAQAQQAGTALLDRPALEAALATEQGQLADAMVARDLAATNLVTAQNTYDAAVLAEAGAQAAYDALMGDVTAATEAVAAAQTDLANAQAAQIAAANELAAAQAAVDAAALDVPTKQAAVDAAQAEVDAAVSTAAATQADLDAAAADLATAQAELDAALAAFAAAEAAPGFIDDVITGLIVTVESQQFTVAQQAYNDAAAADAAADADLAAKQAVLTSAQTALSEATAAQTAAAATLFTETQQKADADAAVVLAETALSMAEADLVAANAAVTTDAGQTAQDLANAEAALGTATTDLATAQGALASAEQAVIDEQADVAAAEAALMPFDNAAAANAAVQALLTEHGVQMDGDNVLLGNVAADLGDTAPFNSFFTIFGQFFDHGLDLTQKGGTGSVYMMLQPDDPLYVPGSPTNFMVLTRATNQAGPDGLLGTADDIRENANETTPWIDLNQVYTSNPSHQVFLREYVMVDGKPVATGHMLESATGGPPTWADIKDQARNMLGIELSDLNVHSVPAVLTDLYGEFVRGANGFPQLVTTSGAVEGQLPTTDGGPALTTTLNALSAGRAFLNDIAHDATPGFVDHDRNPQTGAIQKLPDADGDTANAQPINGFGQATTYDNELLDRHFIVGDGRGNENIALTAVHTVFHGEHNRQVDAVKATLLASTDLALLNEYLLVGLPQGTNPTTLTEAEKAALVWDGERLFQTARFSTEMVYQHLVFEEFVRSVAPQIDPFVFSNSVEIPVGISQEFAQVVYRFGHSMLNETVDMFGYQNNELGLTKETLFDAFLNPVMFDAQGIDAHAAAGAILRGMTRQHGNEIDEFLTDALRNNLVGLPLDLAALNIARARETGIPSLNEARAQFFAQTGNTYLKPYESWTDFAANIKTPLSVVNFIAAYGTHETITSATTFEAKRDAAMKLVLGGEGAPADRLAFLNGPAEATGLNNVDFWIGGLAEAKMTFGGMLGSTFTFVFEAQMEALQNGDRFYYLSRAQGMNLLTQLESDSFADLIQRNTDGEHLGLSINGAAFQTAAWVLEVDQTKQFNADLGNADPTREMDVLSSMNGTGNLVQRGDNYLKYLGGEHVVIGGTAGDDTIIGGAGDDGLWGYDGDDNIEGGFGVDHIHGGEGSDLITDMGTDIGAADVLKGEGGDDLINGGMGLDLIFGGDGRDVLAGGDEAKDIFGGQGDDFIRSPTGGGGIVYGNEGNDWMEGQGNMNTLTGDNSELFFNSRIIGHDVMIAGENDTDFDAESGDDIMIQGIGINRNNGMAGFDWVSYKGNNYDADADMNISIFVNQQNNILRDRFDLVEGLSGWNGNDKLTGREVVVGAYDDAFNAAQVSPTSPIASYSNALLEENVDMIDGLRELVDHLQTFTLTQPNTGEVKVARMSTVNGDDIILGGGGNDTIKGMAGDDIIDGDKWLNVRIELVDDANNAFATTDGLTKQVISLVDGVVTYLGQTINAVAGEALFGGKTLEAALFAREVKAADLNVVREIIDGDAENTGIDTAVYWDERGNYDVTVNADDSVTVTHTVANAVGPVDPTSGRALSNEGSDRLSNIERVQFGLDAGAPTLSVINGTDAGTTITGSAFSEIIFGGGGDDLIRALDGADTISGGLGNDTINAGTGDDTIHWFADHGVDVVNGQGGNLDTFVVHGNQDVETFRIYAVALNGAGTGPVANINNRANLADTLAASGVTLLATTEIVITREVEGVETVVAQLDNIEEIAINTLALGNGLRNGTSEGDTIRVIGNFNPTSLNFNTITIDGSEASETVDISGLESAHRILFRSNGGNDFVVGTLRAQDVIEIAEGSDPATYTETDNGDGTITMSDGTHSVTFTGTMESLPTLAPKGTHQPGEGEGEGSSGTGSEDIGAEGEGSEGTETEGAGTEDNSSGGNDDVADDEAEDADDDAPGSGTGSGTGTGTGTGGGVPVVDGVVLMPGSAAGVMVGDAGDDVIVGGEEGDALLGKGGSDIILGNGGNDVAVGGSGGDVIEGGAGRDVLLGGEGDDVFLAASGDGADMLFGGEGSDTLDLSALTEDAVIDLGAYTAIGTARIGGVTDHLVGIENATGGMGNDVIKASLSINVLTGGDGDDVFVFVSAGTADGDVITDFRPGDKIDLSGIDAMVGMNGNQAFTLADQGTTAAGSLVIREVATENGVDTIIDGFTDGDADADFSITLRGAHTLDSSSFNF